MEGKRPRRRRGIQRASHARSTEHLQNPEFLEGAGQARDWQDTGAWLFHWHRFIDHIAFGKEVGELLFKPLSASYSSRSVQLGARTIFPHARGSRASTSKTRGSSLSRHDRLSRPRGRELKSEGTVESAQDAWLHFCEANLPVRPSHKPERFAGTARDNRSKEAGLPAAYDKTIQHVGANLLMWAK